jgi:hypothetical protein
MTVPFRLKKIAIIAAIAIIPLLFCANVWQSFRYSSLKREIARLEAVQQDLLEQNKRNITGISVLESPQRIDTLGRERLGLRRPGADDFITIRPPRQEAGSDE